MNLTMRNSHEILRTKDRLGRSAVLLAIPMACLLQVPMALANDDSTPTPCGTCACSSGSNSPGTGSGPAYRTSVSDEWSLGFVRPASGTDSRKEIPKLSYWTASVTASALSPTALSIEKPQNAEVIRKNSAIRQVRTVNGFTDIPVLTTGTGFKIVFYDAADIGNTKQDGLYVIPSSAVPFKTVVIRRTDSGSTPSKMEFAVTENYTGVPKTKLYTYERTSGDPTNNTAALAHTFRFYDSATEDASALWTEVTGVHTPIAGGEPGEYEVSRIEKQRRSDGTMEIVDKSWKRVALYKTNEPAVLEHRHGVSDKNDSNWITRELSTYYTNPAETFSFNKVQRVDREPGGQWTTYTYVEDTTKGTRTTTTTEPWLDGTVNRVSTSVESLFQTNDSGSAVAIAGQIVSSSTTTRQEASSTLIKETTTTLTAAGNIAETTWRHANRASVASHLRGRPQKIQHSDGTWDIFTYSTLDGGSILVTLHDSGASDGTTVSHGTRKEIREKLATGNTIYHADFAIEDGNAYLLEKREAVEFTRAGEPTKWVFNDNPNDYTQETRDCCRVTMQRSRDGVTTDYLYDGLGRRIFESSQDIETHTYYNGLETKVTRSFNGGTEFLISRSTRNLAGDTTGSYQPNPNGGETGTTYVTNHATHTVTATRAFDSATTVTESYLDGQTKKVTGSATSPVRYQYALHQENGCGIKTTTIALDDSGADTAQQSIRYTGPNYETLKLEVPDDASDADGDSQITEYTYEPGTGRLNSTTDPDGVTTFFQYNSRGERYRTILDLDGDNLAELNTDRVTETARVYDPATAAWKTTTAVAAGNDASLTTVSTSLSKPDGTWAKSTTLGVSGETIVQGPSMLDRIDGVWTETTTLPDGNQRVRTFASHRLQSEKTLVSAGTTTLGATSYEYDDFGRLKKIIHPRLGETRIIEPASGLVTQSTSSSGKVTKYAYDSLGRVTTTTLPDNSVQHTTYTTRSQVEKSWGSQTNPTLRGYDVQGRLKTLTTYQSGITDEASFATASSATTTWNYYPATGLLERKLDATNKGATYTYTPAGRLKTRTWQRGIATSYGHDPAGQLETVAYSDNTPPVGYTYDRLGRQDFIRQGTKDTAGVREWDYQYNPATLRLEAEALAFDTNDDGVTDFTPTVRRGFDALGRASTLALAEGAVTHHSQTTRYWGSGRTMGIDVAGLPRPDTNYPVNFIYEYRTDIPESWWKVSAPVHIWETAMDLNRPALNRASSRLRAGGPNISSYSYSVNEIGQRQTVTTSGSAMAAPATTRWGYDSIGQLVSEDFANNQSANPRDRGYAYDLIGNRENSIQGSTNPLAAGNLDYDANPLNQYENIGTFQPVHDDDGNLTTGQLHTGALAGLIGTPYTGTLHWNGENRLTKVEDGSTDKATYQYDFMGRRVRKEVGNTITWYAYDGFNELGRFTQNGTSAPAIQRTYTWGLDISNTPQGAGGVGGLLAVKVHGTTSATYYPTYDANGNISEYIASNGSVAAHFEYDGFGNTVVSTDTNGLFDYRFSTKPLEDVTGLYYYLYRHYDPVTGRWPSRDPIEEKGGVNLYGFVGNDGVSIWDILGGRPGNPRDWKPKRNPRGGCNAPDWHRNRNRNQGGECPSEEPEDGADGWSRDNAAGENMFHKGNKCYRKNDPNNEGSSFQCCYDKCGKRVDKGGYGAGTYDYSSPSDDPIGHIGRDMIPSIVWGDGCLEDQN